MMLLIGIGPWQGCEPPRIYGRGNMARACKSKILGLGTRVYQAVLGTSKLKVSSIIGLSSLLFLKVIYVLLRYCMISVFFLMKIKSCYHMFSFSALLTVPECFNREACEAALIDKCNRDVSEKEGFVDETHRSTIDQLNALNLVFKKAAEDDTPTEVSIDVFVCSYGYHLVEFP